MLRKSFPFCFTNIMNQRLNLPDFEFKISEREGKRRLWDPIRMKYVAITPEEIVRQGFVSFLIGEKKYPASHISNEQAIVLNGMNRRCDSVVYDKNGCPKVIIEYKAPTVVLSQKVFDQISKYNFVMHVDYLIVSNGMNHYCVKMNYDNCTYSFLTDIPYYNEL